MNKVVFEYKYKNLIFKIIHGDLTKENVDAIVNAANSHLQHGGGVARAISVAGGPVIQEESDKYVRKHGTVPTGEVAVTSAGNLNAKFVIHAVGPIWRGGNANEEKLLFKAVFNSLKKAEEMGLQSISFPAISSGIYGYPFDKAIEVYKKAIEEFDKLNPIHLKEVHFCFLELSKAEKFATLWRE